MRCEATQFAVAVISQTEQFVFTGLSHGELGRTYCMPLSRDGMRLAAMRWDERY